MRPIVRACVLACILAVALAACSRSEAPPAPPAPPPAPTLPSVQSPPPPGPSAAAAARRVASVALGTSIDPSKQIAAPQSVFAPTDTIYASVTTAGNSPVTLVARWTYEDGQVVNESTQQAEAGPSTTEFHISKPSGWPAGSYQVEILADGTSSVVQQFEVR